MNERRENDTRASSNGRKAEAPAGQRHERAGNEDDPRLHPLRGIYGGHCPPRVRVAQSFPRIGTPMTVSGTSMPRVSPPPQAWPLQPAKPPEVSPACATAR